MDLNKEKIIAELKKQNKLEKVYNLFEKGLYDSIFEEFGRDVYLLFTPSEYKKQDIKKLLNNKMFATLYNKYGKSSKFIVRDVRKYIKKDIDSMMKSGNFEDIYNKYGEHEYNKRIKKMQEQDILNEVGKTGKYKLYKANHILISGLKNLSKILMVAPISVVAFIGGINIYNQNVAALNHELFLEEHIEYEQRIEDYAEQINSMNLDDLQIIMKVIDDSWNMIDGYGNPKYDVYGSWRLDVTLENGAVRCRNLADDFTAKMNEINPNYNARNLPVYQDASYYTDDSVANITRKVDYSAVTDKNIEKYSDFTFQTDKDMTQYLGNHMVTMLEIPNENVTLVVDSLNPSIGVLKNGEIYMFSTIDGKGLEDKPLGSVVFTPMGDCFSNCISEIKSYTNDNTIEELNYKYGLQAQNEALEYIRNLSNGKTR